MIFLIAILEADTLILQAKKGNQPEAQNEIDSIVNWFPFNKLTKQSVQKWKPTKKINQKSY